MLFSAELPMLFYIVQVSRYLGMLEKPKKSNKKSAFPKLQRCHRGATGKPGGTQKGVWRGPPPGRAIDPPGWVPHPLVPYLGPIFTLREETPEKKLLFQSTSRSRRHPLFFSGRANLEAALASYEGKSSPSSSPSPLHHPSMSSPLMCQ